MAYWIINLLAGLNGLWMIFDGAHVIRSGKFFGPDVPGPWRHLVEASGFDPFRTGPFFIFFGVFWIASAFCYALGYSAVPLIIGAILGLWYFPVGTLISIIVLTILYLTGHAL